MELKEYQTRALETVGRFLKNLAASRSLSEDIVAKYGADEGIDFAAKAWEKSGAKRSYQPKRDGLNRPLPNVCLKVPTGGGKTLLAVKSLDLINSLYLRRRTGLVVWIVPTTQIYRQTIRGLRDREHPYRQHLDMASGGRTKIVEKGEAFTPLDIRENLVVLMLMLPSANRETKETLRMYRDHGGFQAFFPPEDDKDGHAKLVDRIPNLDCFEDAKGFWGRQVKTSLANTMRLFEPVIILDEGHKAYSEQAQKTLCGFNPSFVLELSATPTAGSNVLVDILGIELHREEMIKLDLHIINKASTDYKDTLLAAVERRAALEKDAMRFEAATGRYIRPINVIQVERTGKEQRGGGFIHSEEVREWLVGARGIPAEQVAVKTSETDELKEVDDVGGLLSRDCPIRYIITKQALQEGWDCPFAYVLTILPRPGSKNALTQLVGRILRQPEARQTGMKTLDESYVYCYKQNAVDLLDDIKKGFGQEGLGDLAGHVVADEGGAAAVQGDVRIAKARDKFRRAVSQVVLPLFVVRDGGRWRPVSYQADIESRIRWGSHVCRKVADIALIEPSAADTEILAGLSSDVSKLVEKKGVAALSGGADITLDSSFVVRHLTDIVPNPWVAGEVAEEILGLMKVKHGEAKVAGNILFIVEEIRKCLAIEKDALAKGVFDAMLKAGEMRFMVIREKLGGDRLPEKQAYPTELKPLVRRDGEALQRSLFDFVPREALNDLERDVAWFLEDQGRLFFWYRNRSRLDYGVQGWQKHKVYPDFIFTTTGKEEDKDFSSVYIVETKGLHLKNEDTDYKRKLFDLCNEKAEAKGFDELQLAYKDKTIEFRVLFSDEWRRELNEVFEG